MSTKTINSALDFMPEPKRSSASIFEIVARGFSEGLEAANTYKTLTARGVASEEAARRAMAKITAR